MFTYSVISGLNVMSRKSLHDRNTSCSCGCVEGVACVYWMSYGTLTTTTATTAPRRTVLTIQCCQGHLRSAWVKSRSHIAISQASTCTNDGSSCTATVYFGHSIFASKCYKISISFYIFVFLFFTFSQLLPLPPSLFRIFRKLRSFQLIFSFVRQRLVSRCSRATETFPIPFFRLWIFPFYIMNLILADSWNLEYYIFFYNFRIIFIIKYDVMHNVYCNDFVWPASPCRAFQQCCWASSWLTVVIGTLHALA